MADIDYRFEYIPPGLLKRYANDFLLIYHQGGKEISFLGGMPRGDSPGYLDFPSEESWSARAVPWARDERATIESRLLEYAQTSLFLKWVTPEKFGNPSPLIPQSEAEAKRAELEAALIETEVALKRLATLRRVASMTLRIVVAVTVLLVGAALFLRWH